MKYESPSVHRVLASSYMTYLLLCTFGLFADMFFPFRINVPEGKILAIVFLSAGPLLIAWAQYTSHTFEKIKQKVGQPQFLRGPYRYLRNPTQLGLLLLVAGYALATGALMLFLATVLAYVISNVFFRKHETILESRYGDAYRDYKSSVKKVL